MSRSDAWPLFAGGQPRFMPTIDASGGPVRSTVYRRHRRRHDWVRGDVRCLMCGRLLGRLLGTARHRENGDRTAGQPIAFLAYRRLDPEGRIVPFTPSLRFRCHVCGGAGALDEVDVFSTYDELPIDDAEEEEPVARGPGRPPRPFPPPRSAGLDTALQDF